MSRVAVFAAHGKTGRAVTHALQEHDLDVTPIGHDWSNLKARVASCDAAYLIAPNMHPDEAAYVADALSALGPAAVSRVVYHSVVKPDLPAMPHHLGKLAAEQVVRESGAEWTILQPCPYLQNFDLRPGAGTLRVPYDVDQTFGFVDLADVGEAAATVLLEDGHVGATYELASVNLTVRELAASAGLDAEKATFDPPAHLSAREIAWLQAMFDWYDDHGMPGDTAPLARLLGRRGGD